jgi:hypothetical protein
MDRKIPTSNQLAWQLYTEVAIHITDFSESAMCGKCEQEKETSCHILYQCPSLGGHRVKIFGCVQLKLVAIWMVLVLALPVSRAGHNKIRGA